MRFTESVDGTERVTIRVEVRLTREELLTVANAHKHSGLGHRVADAATADDARYELYEALQFHVQKLKEK